MSYKLRLEREIDTYKDVQRVHSLPSIRGYWSERYLRPKIENLGYAGFRDMFVRHIALAAARVEGDLEIVSIGAGNCDFEIAIASKIEEVGIRDYCFKCLDINTDMLRRGRDLAEKVGLSDKFTFAEDDFNSWRPSNELHIVIGNHSLHHVVELENLFDGIRGALHPEGFFLINDMIGRNGHMRWPETEFFLRLIWPKLDNKYRYNHQLHRQCDEFLNWDCSKQGFEGIRAQDILPLLRERFHFSFFFAFAALITPFVGRSYGPNFDPTEPRDCRMIDSFATLDERLIEGGVLTPTQMFAALSIGGGKCQHYKHLTPEFCMRDPDADPSFITDSFI